jgi:hypothetical protein
LVERSGERGRGRTGRDLEKAGILIKIGFEGKRPRGKKAGSQMGQMRGKHFYWV